jgi:hypothetical protein
MFKKYFDLNGAHVFFGEICEKEFCFYVVCMFIFRN